MEGGREYKTVQKDLATLVVDVVRPLTFQELWKSTNDAQKNAVNQCYLNLEYTIYIQVIRLLLISLYL